MNDIPRRWSKEADFFASAPKPKDMLTIAEQKEARKRIAELEEHNELLRDALKEVWESYHQLLEYAAQIPGPLTGVISGFFMAAVEKTKEMDGTQAAIDGGALEDK